MLHVVLSWPFSQVPWESGPGPRPSPRSVSASEFCQTAGCGVSRGEQPQRVPLGWQCHLPTLLSSTVWTPGPLCMALRPRASSPAFLRLLFHLCRGESSPSLKESSAQGLAYTKPPPVVVTSHPKDSSLLQPHQSAAPCSWVGLHRATHSDSLGPRDLRGFFQPALGVTPAGLGEARGEHQAGWRALGLRPRGAGAGVVCTTASPASVVSQGPCGVPTP